MTRVGRLSALAGFVMIVVGVPSGLQAQELEANDTAFVPVEEAEEIAPTKLPDGLYPALTLGANLNLSSNSNVVGQVDGLAVLTGISVAGELHYINGMHNWRNRLSLTEAWSKTPTLDRFVKSNDVLELESLYKLFLWPLGGMYARFNLVSTVFPTTQVTSDPQTYVLEGDPGVGITTDELDLADPFQPLTINESIGAFLDPVQKKEVNVSLRAGFGGRHTFAEGARLITNDDDPDAIQFINLEDVHQAGLELFAGVGGRTLDDRFSYDVGLVSLFPFINNDDTDRSSLELTRVAFSADLTASVFEWMGVSYQLRLINDPQLVDDMQVQNNLLLTISYTVVDKPEAPEEPDPLEAELAAQKARADAAEARAREAEARLQAAEQGAAGAADGSEPTPAGAAPETPPADAGAAPPSAPDAAAPAPAKPADTEPAPGAPPPAAAPAPAAP